MTQLITKDTTIGDIVARYPQVAHVFMKYGLHCVGCHVAYWETLEQGCMGHGMPNDTFEKLLVEANEAADKSEAEKKDMDPNQPVLITKNAIAKVKELMDKHNTHGYLRIRVMDGGCSGKSYDFAVEEKIQDDDLQFEVDGLKVAIASDSVAYLTGSKIDYVESFQTAGFKVDNPNASENCGCGSSFA